LARAHDGAMFNVNKVTDMQSTKHEWEMSHYGISVAALDSSVRDSRMSPRNEALREINFAVCLLQANMGESNRDEIVQALHRAQWILNNKVSGDRPV
jgi:hypothetical protein